MSGTATKLKISVIRKPALAGVDVAEAALEWMVGVGGLGARVEWHRRRRSRRGQGSSWFTKRS
jgi:hypothetical protein